MAQSNRGRGLTIKADFSGSESGGPPLSLPVVGGQWSHGHDGVSPVRVSSFKPIATPNVVRRTQSPFATLASTGSVETTKEEEAGEGSSSSSSSLFYCLPTTSRCAKESSFLSSSAAQTVSFVADTYDRRWLAAQNPTQQHLLLGGSSGSFSASTVRSPSSKGNPWATLEVFERIMTELEVLSFRNQVLSKVHIPSPTLQKWSSATEAPLLFAGGALPPGYSSSSPPSKDDLSAFVKKVEEYWFEKRSVYPTIVRTGLIPELARIPEEADGNSGEASDGIPLPFMRRSGAERWHMKPREGGLPSPTAATSEALTAIVAFVESASASAAALVEREELRNQHSQLTVAQLALMREEALGGSRANPDEGFSFGTVSSRSYDLSVALSATASPPTEGQGQ